MTGYINFTKEIRERVAFKMGEGVEAEVRRIAKANEGAGRGIDDIAGGIVDAYPAQAVHGQEILGNNPGNIREYGKYGNCRHRIYFRLVNTERNRVYLKDVLHIEVLDLSAVFYVLVGESSSGIASMPVKEGMLKLWGVPTEEAIAQAWKNTPTMFPVKVQSMVSVLENLLKEAGAEREGKSLPEGGDKIYGKAEPYIMTNTKSMNGFTVVIYPDALKDFSSVTGTDLYILPSSLHEAILLPADSCIEPQELQDMVGEVNKTAVMPEDFLSDSVYYYSREKNELRVTGKEGLCVKL